MVRHNAQDDKNKKADTAEDEERINRANREAKSKEEKDAYGERLKKILDDDK